MIERWESQSLDREDYGYCVDENKVSISRVRDSLNQKLDSLFPGNKELAGCQSKTVKGVVLKNAYRYCKLVEIPGRGDTLIEARDSFGFEDIAAVMKLYAEITEWPFVEIKDIVIAAFKFSDRVQEALKYCRIGTLILKEEDDGLPF